MNINKKNKAIEELENTLMFSEILKKVDKKTLKKIDKIKKDINNKIICQDTKE